MPNPPDGLAHILREQTSRTGEVSRSLEERLPDLGHDDDRPLRDLRAHRTLSGERPVGDDLRIEAGRPIRVTAGLFEKYRVMLRDPAATAWIRVDGEVSPGLGQYDDVLPGGNEAEEYCARANVLSIVFDVVPVGPVEVFLYAGRFALPK